MPSDDLIPADYISAIGEVVVRWNSLEFYMNIFLIHLLGRELRDPRPHVVFVHMAFPQKLDVLGALAELKAIRYRSSRLKKYQETVLPLLRKAQAGRNWVIHSNWIMQDGKVLRASSSARGTYKFSSTVTTLEEIEQVNQSIEEARIELAALVKSPWNKLMRQV